MTSSLLDEVESRLDEIAERSVRRFFETIPAYSASSDPGLHDDATVHTRGVFAVLFATMREHRPAGPEDFLLTREHASRRVRQGIGLSDFMHAFRIGQVTLWEAIVGAVGDEPEAWHVAVEAATRLMNVIEVGSLAAAAAYTTVQQLDAAEHDRARRDLAEDLLAGRPIGDEAGRAVALQCGLGPTTPVAVIRAEPSGPHAGETGLRTVLTTIRSAIGDGGEGLAVVRQEQILAVAPVPRGIAPLIAGLESAREAVRRVGIELALGVSTVHAGLESVPEAHREAGVALAALSGASGIRALSTLSVVEYLVLRDDSLARRLIRPRIREFIEDDLARGGILVDTVRVYVASDLNAKVAAERLHLHVNTAYYRLDQITARTELDLRSFADLEELMTTIRILAGPGENGRVP